MRAFVVTGASTGIGRATCEELVRRGLRVFGSVRRPEDGALWMQNKWLLAHAGAAHLVERGAMVGLTGPLLEVKR